MVSYTDADIVLVNGRLSNGVVARDYNKVVIVVEEESYKSPLDMECG